MPEERIAPRDSLADLRPYVPHRYAAKVRLHANESPLDLPADLKNELIKKVAATGFNRYPDSLAVSLREAIADGFGLTPENVLVGNGSNEVIQTLLLAYGGPERLAVVFEPTYTMHGKIAQITGTALRSLSLTDRFDLSLEVILPELEKLKPDIVFICSPNNPTGNRIDREAIEQLLGAGALVIVDEAYGEFTEQSVVPLLKKNPNLATVKTFSKAFRLAGLRLGYLLAGDQIVFEVNKVKLPYNVNSLSQAVGEAVFQNRQAVLSLVEEIKAERERVFEVLQTINGVVPYPSDTNFILFKTTREGNEVWQELLDQGVLIRNFSDHPGLANCLRVTIGLPEENNAFLEALRESS